MVGVQEIVMGSFAVWVVVGRLQFALLKVWRIYIRLGWAETSRSYFELSQAGWRLQYFALYRIQAQILSFQCVLSDCSYETVEQNLLLVSKSGGVWQILRKLLKYHLMNTLGYNLYFMDLSNILMYWNDKARDKNTREQFSIGCTISHIVSLAKPNCIYFTFR